MQCNAEALPFPDRAFDFVSIAFGLRNVTRKERALAEMRRVLRPGGAALVLEFSRVAAPLAPAYDWYSFNVLPRLGKLVANDEASYRYLAESIRMHPDQEALRSMMEQAGLRPGRIPQPHRGRGRGPCRPRLLILLPMCAILQVWPGKAPGPASLSIGGSKMNRLFVMAAVLVATTAWMGADLAEAKRMGGGSSIGAQRQMTPPDGTQRPPAPHRPRLRRPPQAAAPKAAPPRLPPRPAPRAGWARSPAWPQASASRRCCRISACRRRSASFLLLALMVGAGFFLVRWLMAASASPRPSPLQYAGATPGRVEPHVDPARLRLRAGDGRRRRPAPAAAAARPAAASRPGFDPAPFVEQAKLQFRSLQVGVRRAATARRWRK